MNELSREGEYLDSVARKALSPLSLYSSDKTQKLTDDNDIFVSSMIKEPHRISKNIKIREIPKTPNRFPSKRVEKMQFRWDDFDLDQNVYSKTPEKNKFSIQNFEKTTPAQRKLETLKYMEERSPIRDDEDLDSFVDNISDYGKWND